MPVPTSGTESYEELEDFRKTNVESVKRLKETISNVAADDACEQFYEEQKKVLDGFVSEQEKVHSAIYKRAESSPTDYAKILLEFQTLVSSVRAIIHTKIVSLSIEDPDKAMESCVQDLLLMEAYTDKLRRAEEFEAINVIKKKLRTIENLEISFMAAYRLSYDKHRGSKENMDRIIGFRADFDSRIDVCSSCLESHMERAIRAQRNHNNRNDDEDDDDHHRRSNRPKMPEVVIPVFDGSIDKWQNFYETFKQVVHNDKFTPKIQKFNLLVKYFQPSEKENVLSEFPVREDLYDAAWLAVQNRYNNPRVLKTVFLTNLLGVKQMASQSMKEINRVRDSFSAIITNLNTARITMDQFFVYVVEKSLDPKTLEEWMDSSNSNTCSWKDIKKFMDDKSTKLSTASSLTYGGKKPTPAHSSHHPDPKPPKRSFLASQPLQSKPSCVVCPENHRLFECDTFKNKMSRSARLTVVKKNNLCFNCLCSGHSLRDCPSKASCRTCLKAGKISNHHTFLHIEGSEQSSDTQSSVRHPSSGSQFTRTYESPQPSVTNAASSAQPSVRPIPAPRSSSVPRPPSSFFNPYPENNVANFAFSDELCGLSLVDEEVVDRTIALHVDIEPSISARPHHYVDKSLRASVGTRKSTRLMLLPTAIVHMPSQDGSDYSARALLDSGSNCNFMTESTAKTLGLKLKRVTSSIETVGSNVAKSKFVCYARLRSRYGEFSADLMFKVLPNITGDIPSRTIEREKMNIPTGKFLADPDFEKPRHIDLLLACDVFFYSLVGGPVHLDNGGIMIESMFGWLISGLSPDVAVETYATSNQASVAVTGLSAMSLHVNDELTKKYDEVAKFMEQENFGITEKSTILTPEEKHCEKLYAETTHRDSNGSYVVRLPFRPNITKLTSNFPKAYYRQRALDQKRASDPRYNSLYCEYVGGMKVEKNVSPTNPLAKHEGYHMPHRGMLKESSSTTKLRPVFDASCEAESELSLNDCLLVGPTVQPESFDIFIRFGEGKYALKCDLEKMFLKIFVEPEDRKYLKMLWSEVPFGPVEHLQFNSLPFGLACSPYLATRTIVQIAIDNRDRYPLTCRLIESSFYVDDGLFSVDNKEQAVQLRIEMLEIFSSANMNARKWAANDQSVLHNMSVDDLELPDENDCIKVLGHLWNVKLDTLSINVKKRDPTQKVTRAAVLSTIASFYDIRGFFGPVILLAKLCLRELTLKNVKWDESPDEQFRSQWIRFCDELELLKLVQIPRYFLIDNAINIQLHGFGDASEKAYGLLLFIRSVDADGNIQVALLSSKSRLAPTKRQQTLARLELCAAVLCATVTDRIANLLTINVQSRTHWSDSMVALHWINNQPNRYVKYLGNRIAIAQEHSVSATWKHVPGKLNPADLISRGLWPSEIANNPFYWNGSFLQKPESEWPESKLVVINEDEDVELKKEVRRCHVAMPKPVNHVIRCIEKSSRYRCLINTFVRVFRWSRLVLARPRNPQHTHRMRLRPRSEQDRINFNEPITADESKHALMFIVRTLQQHEFPREFQLCMKHTDDEQVVTLPEKSPLSQHFPKYDKELKVLRIGSRLKKCEFLNPDCINKIILPDCQFAVSMFRYRHLKHNHPPQSHLRGFVRHKFCVLHDTKIAQKVTRSCLKCFREVATCGDQLMAPLPYDRVNASFPFAKCAVDYSGYYEIFASLTHRGSMMKVYVALFKCLQTGAIHLECATALTIEAFFAVLDRMGGRRAYPSDVYIDNATYFTGGERELREIWAEERDQLEEFGVEQNIRFHFTTPASSHAGGIYESGIKSYKHYLRRAMGDEAFDYESFTRLLIKIEADLNSRPLLALSSDPTDVSILTPGHFIVGRPMNERATRRFLPTDTVQNAHNRVQRARQHFWNEWYMHYLDQLHTRPVNFRTHHHYEVGQAVLLREKNVKPRHWKIGCIIATYPSKKDNIIRSVRVRLFDNSEYERHVKYLVLLPQE